MGRSTLEPYFEAKTDKCIMCWEFGEICTGKFRPPDKYKTYFACIYWKGTKESNYKMIYTPSFYGPNNTDS